jgi:arginine utilization protein RocB
LSRYVYTGTVGKLLPCFYVQGKETHVGEPFAGFDASFLAGELVRRIHLNSGLCDCYEDGGKTSCTQPPVALKCRDLKTHYDVQTAGGAFVYFNYLLYTSTVPQVTEKLTAIAREAATAAATAIDEKRRAYGTLTGTMPSGIADAPEVLVYSELVSRADAKLGTAHTEKRRRFAEDLRAAGTDERDAALETVRFICAEAGFKQPLIVLFFAAPYCPHHTLKSAVPEEAALLDSLRALFAEAAGETGEKITMLPFFPCISDASYIKVDDDDESLRYLRANFPEYDTFFPVDFAKIKALNIPGINCGALGKDAHKWTERVYTPYTFGVLPRLLLKLVYAQLGLDNGSNI